MQLFLQVGSILGKGGRTISQIRRDTSCSIRILQPGDMPPSAMQADPFAQVVQVGLHVILCGWHVTAVRHVLAVAGVCFAGWARLFQSRCQGFHKVQIWFTVKLQSWATQMCVSECLRLHSLIRSMSFAIGGFAACHVQAVKSRATYLYMARQHPVHLYPSQQWPYFAGDRQSASCAEWVSSNMRTAAHQPW